MLILYGITEVKWKDEIETTMKLAGYNIQKNEKQKGNEIK